VVERERSKTLTEEEFVVTHSSRAEHGTEKRVTRLCSMERRMRMLCIQRMGALAQVRRGSGAQSGIGALYYIVRHFD